MNIMNILKSMAYPLFASEIKSYEEKIYDLNNRLSIEIGQVDEIQKKIDLIISKSDKIDEVTKETINKLNQQIKDKEIIIIHLKEELEDYNKDVKKLEEKLKTYPDTVDPIADEWNNKYPRANIEYNGRTWGQTDKMIPIDVRLLITPQDWHIHDVLRKNNLYIIDGNYEEGIPKIYNFVKKTYYNYSFDSENYLVPEYWEFPFELFGMQKIKGIISVDCDSWAQFLLSFYIAAGLPEWMGRVVVGNCKLGGHSTNYVYSQETKKFHHLNSTYGDSEKNKISQFPTTDDAGKTDILGIYGVWFSFNNKFAWHKFDTAVTKKEFNKHKDKFKIIPTDSYD